MDCKICSGKTVKLFTKTILTKYNIDYFQCQSCDFIQTEKPYWLDEAYQNAITDLDIGLINRNLILVEDTERIINACFPESKIYLDYAGGYGMYVRMMRDKGFNFFRADPYCNNLFADHFDEKDAQTSKFDIVTAFEFLEHLENPVEVFENLMKYTSNFIFSTELVPENQNLENWIYIAPETGQHIAFFSKKSMEILAQKFNLNYYCKDNFIHIFTKKEFNKEQIDYAIKGIDKYKYLFGLLKVKLYKKFRVNRESLQDADYKLIKSKLHHK
jgi:hypothetical protein